MEAHWVQEKINKSGDRFMNCRFVINGLDIVLKEFDRGVEKSGISSVS